MLHVIKATGAGEQLNSHIHIGSPYNCEPDEFLNITYAFNSQTELLAQQLALQILNLIPLRPFWSSSLPLAYLNIFHFKLCTRHNTTISNNGGQTFEAASGG